MSSFYWYVPSWDGHDAIGGATPADHENVGNDIVVELVNTDFAAPGDPRQDNFVVERIIGQYKLNNQTGADPADRIVHHRVYVADGDQSSVSLRSLYSADDADSSFLWHKVDVMTGAQHARAWGNWGNGASTDPPAPFSNGRLGAFDIKVGRNIPEGRSLLWHTAVKNGGIPEPDGEWFLALWVRVLLREK